MRICICAPTARKKHRFAHEFHKPTHPLIILSPGQFGVYVGREIPNELHTSTPEYNFFYIDDLASDVLPLLIGSFLVALYLVGIFFDVNLIWEAYWK